MKHPVLLCSGLALVLFAYTFGYALEAPRVTLHRVEVAAIQPFYVKPKIKEKDGAEKVKTYGYSSTMCIAYIFNIENPNNIPIMLDEFQFSVSFDGFDVNTLNVYDDSWIPAGKTDKLRVVAVNESFPMIVSLMVGARSAQRLKSMGTSAGQMVAKWWNGISEFSFPIAVKDGTAVFRDENSQVIRSSFAGEWPR